MSFGMAKGSFCAGPGRDESRPYEGLVCLVWRKAVSVQRNRQSYSRNGSSHVTAAVGLGETAGRTRARRSSLFTQTIIWVTGLICLALLLASLVQAWSNSGLMRRVQATQQQTQQLQGHHDHLAQLAEHYNDPFVIESEARDLLGYVRSGEHVVIVDSAATQEQQAVSVHRGAASSPGFWREWWNTFFGN